MAHSVLRTCSGAVATSRLNAPSTPRASLRLGSSSSSLCTGAPCSSSRLSVAVAHRHSRARSSTSRRQSALPLTPPCSVRAQAAATAEAAPAQTNVLVIGGGGREHALCYALRRGPSCGAVLCAPGNVGMAVSGDAECCPDVDVSSSEAVIEICRERRVGLVVVGPEAPLVAGLVDDLRAVGIPAFGPSKEAAALEGSKKFMKDICDKYNVPTAKYKSFTDAKAAKAYIQAEGAPIVVKADGLAAGKGVTVAQTVDEALEAVDRILVAGEFGSAGASLVVEEFLAGEEASFFAVVDGTTALPLASAQDHKAVGDGDTGPNTGGMGAYSPASGILTPEMEARVMKDIVEPTVKGMAAEGKPFTGVLYAGLMIDAQKGVKLLEYNVRFGDPECQVLMMRLQSDLAAALLAAATGRLHEVELKWSPEPALVVVMAAKGYPGPYVKKTPIKGLEEAEQVADDVKVFHAGTAAGPNSQIVSVGGRVLGVTAKGKTVKEAQQKAYQAVERVDWPQGFCRKDIGWRAVKREEAQQGQQQKSETVSVS